MRHKTLSVLDIGACDWLSLAAAPTFAVMALLASLPAGAPDALCSALRHGSPLAGMVPMYLLMSAFHLPPWLRLVTGRRSQSRQTCHSRASMTHP